MTIMSLFTVRLTIVDVLSKGFQRDFPRRKCWKLPIKILIRITIRKSSSVMSYHLQKGFLSEEGDANKLRCRSGKSILFRKGMNLGPFFEAPGKSCYLAGNVSLSL